MRVRPIHAAAGTRLLPAGIHVAPYLSSDGRLVLLAIARGGYLMTAGEIAGFVDPAFEGRSEHVGVRAGQRGICAARFLLEPCDAQDGFLPFIWQGNAGLRGRSLAATLWPRGIHRAPWRDFVRERSAAAPLRIVSARPWIAVDRRHRIVAEMAVPEGEDSTLAREDLLAILHAAEEAVETPTTPAGDVALHRYDDGYGEDDDDSAQDFGDEWKSGVV